MRQILRYLRQHPWQRLVLTLSASLVIGTGAALLVAPIVIDSVLIHRMGSEDALVREQAAVRVLERGRESDRTVRRLESALDTDSDVRFAAVATILSELGRFNAPGRRPIHVDRFWTVRLETTPDADTRRLILNEILRYVFSRQRDSAYIRRACACAAGDSEPAVRRLAALLAALVREDAILEKLLRDDNAAVKAAAILDAGLAGRRALVERFAPDLLDAKDVEVASSAAYALHACGAEAASTKLSAALARCRAPALRDRLLYVLSLRDDAEAAGTVRALVLEARSAKRLPSAMVLLAAGRLNVKEAAPAVREVLRRATGRDAKLRERQVLAALEAAERLDLPVRREVHEICRKLWHPDFELTMIAAARLLGRQLARPHPGAPSREECLRTLRLAATYVRSVPPQKGQPPQAVTTPLASAAAAVALWELAPSATEFTEMPDAQDGPLTTVLKIDRESSALYVRAAARHPATLAGDYVAWHVARTGRPQAFELGLTMLPALGAALPVYNDNERSAGAMLLALAARTDEQRKAAADRIRSRLHGGALGGEDDPFVAGAYRCALAILGQTSPQEVRDLLDLGEFPQRRALTALLVRGDRRALDDLLWGTHITPEDVRFLLIDKGIGEVLAALVPGLPKLEAAAPEDVPLWQVNILRDSYAVGRNRAQVGGKE